MEVPHSRCHDRELLATRKTKRKILEACGIDILPDELLILILSRLTLKEAVRISVLSRRWRYLWQFTSNNLVFEMDQTNAKNGSMMKATKFVNLVNQVMEMHQGPSVDKFIIRFDDLDRPAHNPICDWIRFAMQKEVKVLELMSWRFIVPDLFPDLEKVLAISTTVKPKSSLVSLTSFKLVNISIRDNMIEYLLSNCPHLEKLFIHGGFHIMNLNVVSPSLKSLTLSFCWKLEKLKISAANLVSFEYLGNPDEKKVHIRFQNVPLLSELTIEGTYFDSFIFKPHRHVKYRNQLEKLVLNLASSDVRGMVHFTYVRAIAKLRCLKHLELVIRTKAGESLLFFILLTTRCPFLSTFAVEFIYEEPLSKQEMASSLLRYRRKRSRLNSYQHEHLKLVKLMNFAGYRSDFRFTLALLHISKSLQKLIINFGYNPYDPYRVATTRERAKQLEASLPAGAELVII